MHSPYIWVSLCEINGMGRIVFSNGYGAVGNFCEPLVPIIPNSCNNRELCCWADLLTQSRWCQLTILPPSQLFLFGDSYFSSLNFIGQIINVPVLNTANCFTVQLRYYCKWNLGFWLAHPIELSLMDFHVVYWWSLADGLLDELVLNEFISGNDFFALILLSYDYILIARYVLWTNSISM